MSDPCDPYDPINCSPPGSSVHGILQTRIWLWVAIPLSMGSFSEPRDLTCLSCVSFIANGFSTTEPPGKAMFVYITHTVLGLAGSSAVKIPSACYAGASGGTDSIRGSGISLGGGHGSPLQYSCLGNPMDRGASGLHSTGSPRVWHDWGNIEHTQSVFLASSHIFSWDCFLIFWRIIIRSPISKGIWGK